ncbi:MAG TPA: IPT/TIG domain-containing protein [Candidatus Dormibacteraeota bacterium]|nr:IPT/TIG domain-containing protein [Candidatus Dormibacteraeota bacterium]
MSIFRKPSARLLATAAIALVVLAGATLGPNRSNTALAVCSGPSVTSINHTFGSTAGGLVVNLTGSCFTGLISVHFGTSLASWALISDTSINANSPAHAAGTVDVTVTTNLGTSATSGADQFTFLAPGAACTAALLNPASGSFPAGSTVIFIAGSTGCLNPSYEFWVQYPDGTWNLKQVWGGAIFSWDSGLAPGSYLVHVWASSTGGPTYQAIGEAFISLTGCFSASVSPSMVTQAAGSTFNFTASASGCTTPRFEFFVMYPDGTWNLKQPFSPSPNFSWDTTGLAPGTYVVHAWVNSSGTGHDSIGESSANLAGCASEAVLPLVQYQKAGTVVNMSTSSSGCPNPAYEWWVQYPDSSWHLIRGFSVLQTVAWSTAGLQPGIYTVHAWAYQQGAPPTLEVYGAALVVLT